MKTSNAIERIAAALCAFQAEMKAAKKSAVNEKDGWNYAGLPQVAEVLKPMHSRGLSYAQGAKPDAPAGVLILLTRIMHDSGQWIETESPPFPTEKFWHPQGIGSVDSYARRIGLLNALGIVAEDDDAQSGASSPAKEVKAAGASEDAPAEVSEVPVLIEETLKAISSAKATEDVDRLWKDVHSAYQLHQINDQQWEQVDNACQERVNTLDIPR